MTNMEEEVSFPDNTKLDFPTYDGSEDPLIWLHHCEKFFTNQHTTNQEKVGLASFHMVGETQFVGLSTGTRGTQFNMVCLQRILYSLFCPNNEKQSTRGIDQLETN